MNCQSQLSQEDILFTIVCAHCRETVPANPRNKGQKYCGKPACQRARKTAWEKRKIKTDPVYRANRKESQKTWTENNQGYWKDYRKRKPQKAQRNRILQTVRNRRKRRSVPDIGDFSPKEIAKMDALRAPVTKLSGTFWLVPKIAKMDALQVQIVDMTNQIESESDFF